MTTKSQKAKKERIPWSEAWRKLKDDWHQAWLFDKRGILLSFLFLLVASCVLTITLSAEQGLLGFKQFLLFFAFAFTCAIVIAGAGAFAVAVAGAFTFAFAFTFAGAAYIFALGFIFAFAFTFAGAIQSLNLRAFKYFKRAQKFLQKKEQKRKKYKELSQKRSECRGLFTRLQEQKRSLTLGLAGRRGLGKTTFLHALYGEEQNQAAPFDSHRDLKDREKLQAARIRRLALFVPTPTEFAEQAFLMAILERLAQACNKALIRLLPTVKSLEVEQELREKRRILSRSHWIFVALILLAIGFNIFNLAQSDRAPFLKIFPTASDTLTTAALPTSQLYLDMRDSLLVELQKQAEPLRDSLAHINRLLNPALTREAWNLKGDYSDFSSNKFLIKATWDSLRKSHHWPGIDSLRKTYDDYKSIVDSIAQAGHTYKSLSDSLNLLFQDLGSEGSDLSSYSGWFVINLLLLPLLVAAYYFSREGEGRFTSSAYGNVRNEIALYDRTNLLLERLHFQMSFGETKESGLGYKQSGLQISRKFSKTVQREMRPYTTISLIDEFRNYIADIKMYLNDALKEDNPQNTEPFKIIIAIDELDKILDTEKLHNMLKSMKAIFEIEDVYYFLSISEDALETYRLRHVDTKNEIDSAFTHIIPIPPMDAPGSLAFFIEHHEHWQPELLPAAIVFGGGVPRDMHRISQVFGALLQNTDLKSCLKKLADEDISACEDMLLLNSYLSDEGKQFWLNILDRTRFAKKQTAKKLLDEINKSDLKNFEEINPCSEETAKEQYHHLRSLLRGLAVKGYIYHQVLDQTMPETLGEWPDKATVEQFINDLQEGDAVKTWLDELEILRTAIFELSRNPLIVWEDLNKQ